MLLKVRASFIVSAVWREVSAESEFVLVLFGRSRNRNQISVGLYYRSYSLVFFPMFVVHGK